MRRWFMLCTCILLFALFIPIEAVQGQEANLTQGIALKYSSLREDPSVNSALIRYLKPNEKFTVTGMPNPYWYKVTDTQGNVGHVSSQSSSVRIVSNAFVLNDQQLRDQPSSSAKIIRQLPKGERILVIEKINDSWYKIRDRYYSLGYVNINIQSLSIDFSTAKIIRPIQEQIELAIQQAYLYWGTPYEFQSERLDTSTFDCSDLIQQIFWDTSPILLPSDSRSQGDYVRKTGHFTTELNQLKRGDLVFFMSYLGSSDSKYAGIDKMNQTITHVGIYLGDGKMINTRSIVSGGVRVDTIMSSSWKNRFMYGGSIW